MITWGNTYWPLFLIGASLFFLGPELYALFTNVGNTLSDYAWRQLDVNLTVQASKHGLAWYASFIAWLLASGILTAHIWFRSI